MPFRIINSDINSVPSDARVETSSDCQETRIYPLLNDVHESQYDEIGTIAVDEYSLSRAGNQNCRYVIQTPAPPDKSPMSSPDIVRHCYRSALQIVRDFGLRKVAFPLIGNETEGWPKNLALQIATEEITSFLDTDEDTDILLVIRDKQDFWPNAEVLPAVSEYIRIAESQERRKKEREWNAVHMASTESFPAITDEDFEEERRKRQPLPSWWHESTDYAPTQPAAKESSRPGVFQPGKPVEAPKQTSQRTKPGLVLPFSMFRPEPDPTILDESFSQMMLRKIDEKGFKKDSDFYKKANITKQTFSKMKLPDYHPKKVTAVAVAVALGLSLDDTKELLFKAGYSLSHSILFDVIVESCITQRCYDIFEINEVLFHYDQPLLGA